MKRGTFIFIFIIFLLIISGTIFTDNSLNLVSLGCDTPNLENQNNNLPIDLKANFFYEDIPVADWTFATTQSGLTLNIPNVVINSQSVKRTPANFQFTKHPTSTNNCQYYYFEFSREAKTFTYNFPLADAQIIDSQLACLYNPQQFIIDAENINSLGGIPLSPQAYTSLLAALNQGESGVVSLADLCKDFQISTPEIPSDCINNPSSCNLKTYCPATAQCTIEVLPGETVTFGAKYYSDGTIIEDNNGQPILEVDSRAHVFITSCTKSGGRSSSKECVSASCSDPEPEEREPNPDYRPPENSQGYEWNPVEINVPGCVPSLRLTECSDEEDNDDNGVIDEIDPGCDGPDDNDESSLIDASEFCSVAVGYEPITESEIAADSILNNMNSIRASNIADRCKELANIKPQCSDGINNDLDDEDVDAQDIGCYTTKYQSQTSATVVYDPEKDSEADGSICTVVKAKMVSQSSSLAITYQDEQTKQLLEQKCNSCTSPQNDLLCSFYDCSGGETPMRPEGLTPEEKEEFSYPDCTEITIICNDSVGLFAFYDPEECTIIVSTGMAALAGYSCGQKISKINIPGIIHGLDQFDETDNIKNAVAKCMIQHEMLHSTQFRKGLPEENDKVCKIEKEAHILTRDCLNKAIKKYCPFFGTPQERKELCSELRAMRELAQKMVDALSCLCNKPAANEQVCEECFSRINGKFKQARLMLCQMYCRDYATRLGYCDWVEECQAA